MVAIKPTLKDDRLLRQLGRVNWDFPVRTPGCIENLHWYPGTFPPDLPATLIEALAVPGDLVMDPFAGIGTTGWEAIRLGRLAWLVDQNQVAATAAYVNVALATVAAVAPKSAVAYFEELEHLVAGQFGAVSLGLPLTAVWAVEKMVASSCAPEADSFLAAIRRPNRPALEQWVEKHTLGQIDAILNLAWMEALPSFTRLAMFTLASAVLRAASSQNSSWGHIADNVRPREFKEKDVLGAAIRWVRRTKKSVCDAHYLTAPLADGPRSHVSVHSWTSPTAPNPTPETKAAALITSPPYSCAIDYTMSQRLSFYLFGHTDEEMAARVAHEIGARRKRFGATARANWARELVEAISRQLSFIRADGYVALIMPHKEHGRDNGITAITEFLNAEGWSPIFEADRSIRQVKTRQSWTSIKKETVFIFSK